MKVFWDLLWIEVVDVLHDDFAQDVLLAGQGRVLVHGHHVSFHGDNQRVLVSGKNYERILKLAGPQITLNCLFMHCGDYRCSVHLWGVASFT